MAEKVIIGSLNPSEDGDYCRTIKAQYYKNNIENLMEQGTFGYTGAYRYLENSSKDPRRILIYDSK